MACQCVVDPACAPTGALTSGPVDAGGARRGRLLHVSAVSPPFFDIFNYLGAFLAKVGESGVKVDGIGQEVFGPTHFISSISESFFIEL